MYKYSGVIECKRNDPVIYFILMDQYLYVGETEDHPVIRWGGHLSRDGTFVKKLNQIDRSIMLSDSSIKLWAFECEYIKSNILQIQKNDAIRLTEYYLHLNIKKMINTVRSVIGRDVSLVSDVTSTTPKYFRDKKCEALAINILEGFIEVYLGE